MLNELKECAQDGSLIRLSYDIGDLRVTREDFICNFWAIFQASYEDVRRNFALSAEQLSTLNKWAIEGSRVRLSYDAGDLYVSRKDFNRAFGTIINAPYEVVRRDFAISKKPGLDETLNVCAEQKSDRAHETGFTDRER